MKLRIVIEGKTYDVEYEPADSSPAAPSAIDRIQSLVLPTPTGPGSAGAPDVDESKIGRSPVAGIVTRVHVEPGQSVQSGDILLVVEAMKMENNLASPAGAKVKLVTVKVGDTVKAGQILIEFE